MARRSRTDDEHEQQQCLLSLDPEEEDGQEEALSLCELSADNFFLQEPLQGASSSPEDGFDFGFRFDSGLLSGSPSGSTSMCSADELFSEGRILPLRQRHSVSSELPELTNRARASARSESFDRTLTARSCRSGIVGYKIDDSSTADATRKFRNNFIHTLPSPQPQIRRSSSLRSRTATTKGQKFSVWEILRVGLVRAPEIELQDLKFRSLNHMSAGVVSRNSSCSSSSTSNSSGKIAAKPEKVRENPPRRRKKTEGGSPEPGKRSGFLFNGCKCSVDIAETVPLARTNPLMKTENKQEINRTHHRRRTKPGSTCSKQALPGSRTVEWVKGLSQASLVNE